MRSAPLVESAIAVPTDVRVPEQVEALMKSAHDAYGSIDILINNAAGNFLCRAEKLSYNGWRPWSISC